MSSFSPLGLGTARLASLGSSLTRLQSNQLIHMAIDHGVRVIDTADTYGSGDSERAIAAALGERRREDCFLITKAGFPHVALPAFLSPLNQIGKKVLQKVSPARNFSKAYLLRCLELSLKRLRTDHVDVFLLHGPRANELSSGSWEALELMRAKGMSLATGLYSDLPEVVRMGIASGQVSFVETPMSFASLSAIKIGATCASHQVRIIASHVLKPLPMLRERADKWDSMRMRHGVSQVSTIHLLIAYAAVQPGVGNVLIGTQSSAHLVENIPALQYATGHDALFADMKETFA